MIKKTMIILLALLSCHTLFAQAPVGENFVWPDELDTLGSSNLFHIKAGPKLGFGISCATNPPEYEDIIFQSKTAWQVGAAANIQLGRGGSQTHRFGIEAEILYSSRNISSGTDILTMNCIEIPILFQYYPMSSLALEAGPTIAGNFRNSPDSIQFNHILIHGVAKHTSNDIMITFGASYRLPIGLLFDLRYNIGTSGIAGNFDSKVSSLMVSIVYLFKLSGD